MPLPHFEPITINAAQPTRQRIIEFKLSEEVLEDILSGKDVLQLDMNQSKLLIGETQYDFTQAPGPFSNVEVYSYAPEANALSLVGDITAKCTIQRTHARKGQKKGTKYEHSRTTQIIDANDLRKGSATSTTSSTPAIVPARRIRSASPSAPPSTAAVPLRTRVVQLLALQPRGIPDLKKMLKATQDELQAILTVVATSVSGGKFKLKAETFKEVMIYDWNKYSAKEREVVAKYAEEAFDKLGLGPDAPERDKLIPEKVKHSPPPLVAEGYHGAHPAGQMGDLRWRNGGGGGGGGGGGSESEGGPENGRAAMSSLASAPLKPPSARKKVTTKKTTVGSSSGSGTLTGSGVKRKSVGKGGQMSAEQAAQSILEMVPNHSARALSGAAAAASAGGAGAASAASASTATSTTIGSSISTTATTSLSSNATSTSASASTTTAGATAAAIVSGGASSSTPKLGPAVAGTLGGVAGRRSSLTTSNGVSIKTSVGAEVKKTTSSSNRESGGVGNGYRIPKASSAAARGKSLTTATTTSSSSLSSGGMSVITIPPITSQREFEHVTRQFLVKHQELSTLAHKMEERKQMLVDIGLQLEQALGTDRENDLKRKAQEACGGGEEAVNRKVLRMNGEPRNGVSTEAAAAALAEQKSVQSSSIRAMSDRYRLLHSELSAMKGALWKAGKGQAYSSSSSSSAARTGISSSLASHAVAANSVSS
ncbi:hypothetical protein DFQ26_005519 [Actinomortierella ambigua]|nr:hypothetical protein DFQ26_005519 [Actinomortierella ambigua]